MANLRLTPAWQRANFSTQAQFPAIAKFFRFFPLRYCISPLRHSTFNVPPRYKTMCFMHRPAHYWPNALREKSFHNREGNFNAWQTEKKGVSRLKHDGKHFFGVSRNFPYRIRESETVTKKKKNIDMQFRPLNNTSKTVFEWDTSYTLMKECKFFIKSISFF